MKKFLTSKIGNILLCIAEIIVGVLLLVNPDAVTSAFIIGAGAVMILTGIVFCTLYFVGEAEKWSSSSCSSRACCSSSSAFCA